MKLNFTKMHGCGNDYIYFNCFEQEIADPAQLSRKLSDRHKAVGGDGIVLICPSKIADANMRMFNADGSEAKMCGNAIRCVGKYLYEHGVTPKTPLKIETLSGIKTLDLHFSGGAVSSVTVDMGKAELHPALIPAALSGSQAVNVPVIIGGVPRRITCVSMGNPHCVLFGANPDELDLAKEGRQFETHSLFPQQVNTEFVQVLDNTTLKVRVWERGSGETMACGTGACASVVAAVLNGYCAKNTHITVRLPGGRLVIQYTGNTVFMTGGAVEAFEGYVDV